MKILATGLNGLVGSRVVELLHDKYQFENISRSAGVDITNQKQVLHAVENSKAEVVLHLAAKTDVDGCEKDREKGRSGEAWQINVEGTRHIAEACKKIGKKLVYVSTDFVFDGDIDEGKAYSVDNLPHPINWYGQTKFEGETIVQETDLPWLILRPAYPYRAAFTKKDFMRAIKSRLESGEKVMGITDHIFTPTFIDDFAQALDTLLSQNAKGIYHVVGSESLSPYVAALGIAQVFNLDEKLIGKTTRVEYFKDKAPRPFRLALKNDKIVGLGVRMKTFVEGLEEVKKQLDSRLRGNDNENI